MLIKVILGILMVLILGTVLLLTVRYIAQQKIIKNSKSLVGNGGISEVERLTLGDATQYILIEGAKKTNPVLLMLHGGPGAPFPFGVSSRGQFPELTNDYVVVYWDQRGAGRSYNKNLSKESIHLNQFVNDANELVDYLRKRFDHDKIYLAGQSWGSAIGLHLVKQYPEKFYKYVANAQIVSTPLAQAEGYKWLCKLAEKDKKLKIKLEELGKPPYKERKREEVFGDLLKKNGAYAYKDENGKGVSEFSLIKGALCSPDYTLKNLYDALVLSFMFSWNDQFFKEFVDYDFSHLNDIKVPMIFIQGAEDYICPRHVTETFFNSQQQKDSHKYIQLEKTAHYPDLKNAIQLIKKSLQED